MIPLQSLDDQVEALVIHDWQIEVEPCIYVRSLQVVEMWLASSTRSHPNKKRTTNELTLPK